MSYETAEKHLFLSGQYPLHPWRTALWHIFHALNAIKINFPGMRREWELSRFAKVMELIFNRVWQAEIYSLQRKRSASAVWNFGSEFHTLKSHILQHVWWEKRPVSYDPIVFIKKESFNLLCKIANLYFLWRKMTLYDTEVCFDCKCKILSKPMMKCVITYVLCSQCAQRSCSEDLLVVETVEHCKFDRIHLHSRAVGRNVFHANKS